MFFFSLSAVLFVSLRHIGLLYRGGARELPTRTLLLRVAGGVCAAPELSVPVSSGDTLAHPSATQV